MPGFPKRVDMNQRRLTELWRKMGVSVWVTSPLGTGTDVVLGLVDDLGKRINLLVEIKDGEKVPSAQKLTEREVKFHTEWKGQVCIINSEEQAMALIYAVRTGSDFKQVL